MENLKTTLGVVGAAFLIIIAGVYISGNRISIESRGQMQTAGLQTGQGKGTPGWRNAGGLQGENKAGAAGLKDGSGPGPSSRLGAGNRARDQAAPAAGSKGGRTPKGDGTGFQPGNAPGSGRGGGPGRMGGAAVQAAGVQPGFGPSGGILLPIKLGVEAVPVFLNGEKVGSFLGQDLVDNVEDTVIATPEGPRKGWGVGKTMAYLGIKEAREVSLFDRNGKKTTIGQDQVSDLQTFVLLTYGENGELLLASGPKVRGTNKGITSLEEVIRMVDGRKDLIAVPDIVKIEAKG